MAARLGWTGRTISGIALLVSAATGGCRPADRVAVAGMTVRDSAGIVIVENVAASDGSLELPHEPDVVIGAHPAVEQSPLDPTAVFAGAQGHIFVGDGNQVGWHAILVYDSAGRFAMKMGGPGRGPGEFGGQLWWAGPFRADSVVAWDRRGPSMKIYGPDGSHSRDIPIPALRLEPPEGTVTFSSGFHGAFADGALLTSSDGVLELPPNPGPTWYSHVLLAVDPAGRDADTIGSYRLASSYWDGNGQTSYLYGASGLVVPYGTDLIYGNSAAFEYRITGRDGTLKRIVRKAAEPLPVTPSDVDAVVARFIESARSRGAPANQIAEMERTVRRFPSAAVKPAYSNILVEDSRRVWVERYRWFDPWAVPPDPDPSVWDVFDADGRWLREITVPAGVVLLSVSHGRVYGVHIDSLDVRTVVAFDVDRG